LRFERPWQQVTLHECIDAVKAASARVAFVLRLPSLICARGSSS
jgi:hypothetical protein